MTETLIRISYWIFLIILLITFLSTCHDLATREYPYQRPPMTRSLDLSCAVVSFFFILILILNLK